MEPIPYDWSRPDSPGDLMRAWLEHHSFNPPEPPRADLAQWQAVERRRILGQLAYSPGSFDMNPETISVEQREGYVAEYIRFNTSPWTRVPAFLLIPNNARQPAPAIVCLHDHGGMFYWGREKVTESGHDAHPVLAQFKRDYYGNRSIASELAKRGFVVLVIDMYHWGERAVLQVNDPDRWRTRPIDLPSEEVHKFNGIANSRIEVTARALTALGTTLLGMMLNDDMQSVDYLLTRPEVDARRIGCAGLSVGGYRGVWLSSLDPRIKAAVVVGWMCRLRDCVDRTYNTIGHMKGAPGVLLKWDIPDLMALRAPGALLVQQCRHDGLFPLAGMKNAVERIASIYDRCKAGDRFTGRFYEVPHCFNQAMQDDAFAFLERELS